MYTCVEIEAMFHIGKAIAVIRETARGVYVGGLHQSYVTTLDEIKIRWADNEKDWCAALGKVFNEISGQEE